MTQASTADNNLFLAALECLQASEVEQKLQLAHRLSDRWCAGELELAERVGINPPPQAGLPTDLKLVEPRKLKQRSFHTPEGRHTLLHAIAHIEFNAINLACDAVVRFRDMPRDYYDDWVRVAREEAEHFQLLADCLQRDGARYGDYPAHLGLWDMAQKSAGDPLLRMALVPRLLEARGLDVTPGMIEKFRQLGDQQVVDALGVILREEIGHVEIGNRWFRHLCEQRGLDAEATYFALAGEHLTRTTRKPLNLEARRKAGFSEEELERLQGMVS